MANARLASIFSRLAAELGIPSIVQASRDTKLLCLQRFVRFFAYGTTTLILVLYLSSLDISDGRIGLFMTLTLLGDVVISFLLTLFADGLGRRRILVAGAALMSGSGVVFALSRNYWVLVAASVVGVISPSGSEIGPFRAVEESTLAQLTPKEIRSDIFAWYTLAGAAGAAMGTVLCGWTVELLKGWSGWTPPAAYRLVFAVYAGLGLVKLGLSLMLSTRCEPEPPKPQQEESIRLGTAEAQGLLSDQEPPTPSPRFSRPSPLQPIEASVWPSISPSSRSILTKLCLLFAIDSLASGLVATSWMTYFFHDRFAIPEGHLGTLFFTTNLIAAASSLVAASVAKRIGLVRTMVFTHLPSALCLALIPAFPDVRLAMAFLVLRSCTQSMDQAPRQAFLAAAVLPGERTAVMGIVNVVKTLSQSGGPVVTGSLAGVGRFGVAFVVAGGLKAGYDLSMLGLFLGFRGREDEEDREGGEREEEGGGAVTAENNVFDDGDGDGDGDDSKGDANDGGERG